jgi:hypothetical protein
MGAGTQRETARWTGERAQRRLTMWQMSQHTS